MTSPRPLGFKRPPRPRGRDLVERSVIDTIVSLAQSPMLIEVCEDLPHLETDIAGAPAGRRPDLPPEVLLLFGATTTVVPGDRKVEALLRDPLVWEPIRAHLAPLFPSYKGLQPGSTGPSRSQFHRWYNNKTANNPELLGVFVAANEASAVGLARAMDLFDPDRHNPSHPDIRGTLIGDGTTLKSRFNAVAGDVHIDRATGEIVPKRYDPDANVQYRKSDDGEVIRSDVAGTQFGILHGTTGHTHENVIISVFPVPTGKGNSEAASSIAEIERLKTTTLPGCHHILYDKAMRGTHIDRAFNMGIQLHARVAKTPGGKDKECLVDVKVPAKRGNEIVGHVEVYALRGAAHLRVDIDDTNELVLLEPRQVRERPNRRTSKVRVYREYRIPHDPRVPPHLRHATVSIRHTTNADDTKRGLNRAEVLRLVAEDHDGWGHVAQRSRAEAINAQIKNRWQDKRAPAVGKNRQLLRLLFASLVNNHNAARAYETRTGTTLTGRQPPSQHHHAA